MKPLAIRSLFAVFALLSLISSATVERQAPASVHADPGATILEVAGPGDVIIVSAGGIAAFS